MTGAAARAVEDAAVNPGFLGFLVVALLGVATWLLIRSMTRHLRRVDFPEGEPPAPGADPDPDAGEPPAAGRDDGDRRPGGQA